MESAFLKLGKLGSVNRSMNPRNRSCLKIEPTVLSKILPEDLGGLSAPEGERNETDMEDRD